MFLFKVVFLLTFCCIFLSNSLVYSINIFSTIPQSTKWINKLPKRVISQTLSNISLKELNKYLTKPEKIDFLLDKAFWEGRINPAYAYRLRMLYSKIPSGDLFLYLCLKDKNCNPLKFADKANSWLYQRIIRTFPNIQTIYDLNKIKGDLAEKLTIKFFEKSGWKCLNGKYRGNNGFDGLCVKTNFFGKIKEVLILESKAENSLLAKSQCGKQMSKSCIVSILETLKQNDNKEKNWFQKLFSRNKYQEILDLVEKGKYRRRMVKIKSTKEGLKIEIYKIVDKNFKDVEAVIYQTINANLSNPTTKQDKYIRSLIEEVLNEILKEYKK